MRKGLFITFEGSEGSGKSTQAERLRDWLDIADIPVTLSREPGGTPVGEAVRSILIDPKYKEMDPLTETFLFAASRRQHVTELILPRLERGEVVIADRFYDATLAYQGFGQQLPIRDVEDINAMCAWGATPDLTLLIDVPVQLGLERVRQRYRENGGNLDRLEQLGEEFFERVAEGYRYAAEREPQRFAVLDGSLDRDSVTREIMRTVLPLLQERFPKQSCNLEKMAQIDD